MHGSRSVKKSLQCSFSRHCEYLVWQALNWSCDTILWRSWKVCLSLTWIKKCISYTKTSLCEIRNMLWISYLFFKVFEENSKIVELSSFLSSLHLICHLYVTKIRLISTLVVYLAISCMFKHTLIIINMCRTFQNYKWG